MPAALRPIRAVMAVLLLSLVAACAAKSDLDKPPVPLGRFLLGLNVVVTDGMKKSPVSRDATSEEWIASLKQAVEDRFGQKRYDGDKYYDMSIKVLGYALAPPGIPILLAPKSVLIIEVRFYDDAQKRQLNIEPKTFTVFEGVNGKTIVGSGLVEGKDKQMQTLSYNAIKQIQEWLAKHPQWFPATGDVPEDAPDTGPMPGTPAAAAAAKAAHRPAHPAGHKPAPAAAKAGAAPVAAKPVTITAPGLGTISGPAPASSSN